MFTGNAKMVLGKAYVFVKVGVLPSRLSMHIYNC